MSRHQGKRVPHQIFEFARAVPAAARLMDQPRQWRLPCATFG